jgi:malonyl CoA-acyl carrier protein transacylase
MATLEKYLGKLKDLRSAHAMAVVTNPGEITERNYAYAVGYSQGLLKAEKLLDEVLEEEAGKSK